jgi:hypothetical protein
VEAVTAALAAAVAALAFPGPTAPLLPENAEPRLELEVSDPSPVIGAVTAVEVRLRVSAPPQWGPPRLLASAGNIGPLVASTAGDNSFLARYEPPADRFPQVALLVAELAPPPGSWPGRSALQLLALPLRAPASPAFRTDPGAQVTVLVADRSFGPVIADGTGQVRVTVLVPPGTRTATARSVNTFGKATEQQVDLAPPPFRRLMVLAPTSLQAGAIEEIRVAAVSASGEPLDPARIGLHGSLGRAHPLGGAPGLARFLVRAPASLDARALRLTAVVRGEPETEQEVHIPLRPGPVAELIIRAEHTRLPARSAQPADVFVIGRDAQGNPAPAGNAGVYVDGRRRPGRPLDDGRLLARVDLPPAGRSVLVEAVLPGAYGRQRLTVQELVEGPRVALPDPDRSIAPRVAVLLARGRSFGFGVGVEALTRWRRLPAAMQAGLTLGYLGRRLRVSDGFGFSEVALDEGLLLGVARWRWRARPHIDVSPLGGVGLALVQGRNQQQGYTLKGRDWAPTLTAGVELALRMPAGAPTLTTRYLYTPLGRMSNADVYAGNAGGVVFELGYRVGL